MSQIDEGDELEYGLSIEAAPGVWVKAALKVKARPGETPMACWERASETVDSLLRFHADRLASELSK
jgi:hypothetical protein